MRLLKIALLLTAGSAPRASPQLEFLGTVAVDVDDPRPARIPVAAVLPVQSGKPEPLLMAHVGRKIQSVALLCRVSVPGHVAALRGQPPPSRRLRRRPHTASHDAAATIADQRLAAVKSGSSTGERSLHRRHGLAKCWDV